MINCIDCLVPLDLPSHPQQMVGAGAGFRCTKCATRAEIQRVVEQLVPRAWRGPDGHMVIRAYLIATLQKAVY